MKKFITLSAISLVMAGLTACSNDDDPKPVDNELTPVEQKMKKVTDHYVNNIVIKTYSNLADNTQKLLEACEALQADKTADNVKKACDAWKASRQWWEWSEAYLFGAATTYGIDPHIDTWPLDRNRLDHVLADKQMMSVLDAATAGEQFGSGLLGFHGLEYVIFREGAPRNVNEITDDEMTYAVAIAGDLRNQCYRLEAAWAGMDNISADKRAVLEEYELEPDRNFGEYMLNAGGVGSPYRNLADAIEEIIDGCETIADEVGAVKIGRPASGEDPNYIESPYSYNSIQDFEDNIRGIEAVYYGGYEGSRVESLSLSNLIKELDPAKDAAVREAIANAIQAIRNMPKPFVNNFALNAEVQAAIDACGELTDALNSAKSALK